MRVVDVRLVKHPGISGHGVQFQAWVFAEDLLMHEPTLDLAGLRRGLGELVANGYTNLANTSFPQVTTFTNPFTVTVMIEEDSPGNYRIAERNGRAVFLTYDAEGGETERELELPLAPR